MLFYYLFIYLFINLFIYLFFKEEGGWYGKNIISQFF